MIERFRSLEEKVRVVAALLATKGYEAENPQATEEEAEDWGVENHQRYMDDAWLWLIHQGVREALERKRWRRDDRN